MNYKRIAKVFKLTYLILFAPLYYYAYRKSKSYLDQDIQRYSRKGNFFNLLSCLIDSKPFRNVFRYRTGLIGVVLNNFLKGENTLQISDDCSIGPGIIVVHGTSSYLNAKKIGVNFTVNQNVTIGVSKNGRPSIGNNVTIRAGAIVIGGITIGDNSLIAAGSVVIKDVPSNCMVAGNPAIVKKIFKEDSTSNK